MTVDLDALRKAAEAATAGPWTLTVHTSCDPEQPEENFQAHEGDDWTVSSGGKSVVAMEDGLRHAEDVRFIVAANPAVVLELIDALDAMRSALKGLSAMYTYAWDMVDGSLIMFPDSIPRFENAHTAAQLALGESITDGNELLEAWANAVGEEIGRQAAETGQRAAKVTAEIELGARATKHRIKL